MDSLSIPPVQSVSWTVSTMLMLPTIIVAFLLGLGGSVGFGITLILGVFFAIIFPTCSMFFPPLGATCSMFKTQSHASDWVNSTWRGIYGKGFIIGAAVLAITGQWFGLLCLTTIVVSLFLGSHHFVGCIFSMKKDAGE